MEIEISNSDITKIAADLIVMKYADAFHGADQEVAEVIGFEGPVEPGNSVFVGAPNIPTPEVLFIGVGPLSYFRYERIQQFGASAIALAREHDRTIRHLAMTIHGPGYGLGLEQSFLSMIAGVVAEWRRKKTALETVTIVERSKKRCELLGSLLEEQRNKFGLAKGPRELSVTVPPTIGVPSSESTEVESNVVEFGARSEQKPRLFVAMPFAEEFFDEFEIGFCEAAKACNFVCERLDLEHFTGDIVAEIKRRIVSSHGVIALLNDHNPNVFLEVGFSLAHGKPTILVAREETTLPFDVSGQRCIRYRNISQLRSQLTEALRSLAAMGVLARSDAG